MSEIEQPTEEVISICPGCDALIEAVPYDIGSGPELSCPHCEMCWGAEGQPLDSRDALRAIGQDPELRRRFGWEDENGKPNVLLAFTECKECGKTVASKWHWETGTTPVESCSTHQ